MSENEDAFGRFIKARRKALGITIRGFAAQLEIAPPYLYDIENGHRFPPDKKLDKIADILQLNGEDRNYMMDLAALTKSNTVPFDLPDYIMKKDLARVALRRAKAVDLSDDGWQEVIDLINRKTSERLSGKNLNDEYTECCSTNRNIG